MKVALLQSITTEEALTELEANGEKYTGLFVDMDDAKQRKYVKDNASLINGLLKKVDRARIDLAKDYRSNIEAEAKSITERLEAANSPFSSLIDAYAEKRKAILAEEKRIADEVEAVRLAGIAQAERDEHHEMAILMMAEDMRQREAQAEQARLDQIARDESIALEATQKAEEKAKEAIAQAELDKKAAILATMAAQAKANQDAIDAEERAKQQAEQVIIDRMAAEKKAEQDRQFAIEQEKQRQLAEQQLLDNETAKREANTKHKGKIHSEILTVLVDGGLDVKKAKGLIGTMSKGLLPHVSINY